MSDHGVFPKWRFKSTHRTWSDILSEYWIGLPTIMDKSVDTFEQNKCFLSTSLHKFKKHLFCLQLNPLSPSSMLKYASWTLPRGYNIEKGRGGRKVKIWHWKTHTFNETGLFRGVSQLLLSMIVAHWESMCKRAMAKRCDIVLLFVLQCTLAKSATVHSS